MRAIPKSNAKTAWGLLQDVKRVILAEPKRANMGSFVQRADSDEGGPACGTVGCVAGWIALLTPGSPTRRAHAAKNFTSAYNHAEGDALGILGDNNYRTVPGGLYVFNAGKGDACETTKPGTRAHARAVVSRINQFMRFNETALKARKLKGWEPRGA